MKGVENMRLILGISIYVFLFIAFTILISDVRTSKEDTVFFSIIFGLGMLAVASDIW